MIRLTLLRHGPTDWTEAGRIQGRSDPPLSEAGRRAVPGWAVPPEPRRWLTSPLRRCRETADLLGLKAVIEPALIEMAWGAWEGQTLSDLRASDAMAANEARGLDFTPPGGESPRQVQQRLIPWLRRLDHDTGAITHKGVIRALYAFASGWNMTGATPLRLKSGSAITLTIAADGTPGLPL